MTNRQKENIGFVIRLIIALIFISPLFICLVFSFVPDEKLFAVPTIKTIVSNLTGRNYIEILKEMPVFMYVKTSLVLAIIVIVMQLTISSLAAYAFAYMKFRFKNFWFTLILVAMMVPGQVVTITNFITVRDFGLLNTYLGLTIVSFAGGRSLFMMRQSFLSLPMEMKEAATLDGCGDFRYLVHFAVPLSLPSIASVSILLFIGEFNSYLWPILVARKPQLYTIQIGMASMVDDTATPRYGKMMAVAVMSLVVPLLAFLIGEDYLISGMTKGAIKG
ncbi:MAG: carbohydrate ABC transporter permease [Sphaerochaetaceae bacterium]|nr:carbohydrate ABC transporter permease [Sphaerochaetaceae bacterium]